MKKMTTEIASNMLNNGFHCSQCVMSHGAHLVNIDEDVAKKLSAGLGGGCFKGSVCGCVTAAIITLGFEYGFCKENSIEQDEILINKVHEFENKFIEKHGSIVCKDLLGGYNQSIPEEKQIIIEKGLFANCSKYSTTACDILDEMFEKK